MSNKSTPTLRVARPTNNLPALTSFYTQSLNLQIVSSFNNHNGFDGVMLGYPGCPWHLEFTYQHGVTVSSTPPTKDNLLAFYEPDKEAWERAVKRVEDKGGKRVESENPWWNDKGITFEDPDGWRVVLHNSAWSK